MSDSLFIRVIRLTPVLLYSWVIGASVLSLAVPIASVLSYLLTGALFGTVPQYVMAAVLASAAWWRSGELLRKLSRTALKYLFGLAVADEFEPVLQNLRFPGVGGLLDFVTLVILGVSVFKNRASRLPYVIHVLTRIAAMTGLTDMAVARVRTSFEDLTMQQHTDETVDTTDSGWISAVLGCVFPNPDSAQMKRVQFFNARATASKNLKDLLITIRDFYFWFKNEFQASDNLRAQYEDYVARTSVILSKDMHCMIQDHRVEIDNLHQEGLRLRGSLAMAKSSLGKTIPSAFLSTFNDFERNHEAIDLIMKNWAPRVDPVVVLVKGRPGTGKTTLVDALAKYAAVIAYDPPRTTKYSDCMHSIYYYGKNVNARMDGLTGDHRVIVAHDLFMKTNADMIAAETELFANLADSAPFFPDVAEIKWKRLASARQHFLFVTTNWDLHADTPDAGIRDPYSIIRRCDFFLEMNERPLTDRAPALSDLKNIKLISCKGEERGETIDASKLIEMMYAAYMVKLDDYRNEADNIDVDLVFAHEAAAVVIKKEKKAAKAAAKAAAAAADSPKENVAAEVAKAAAAAAVPPEEVEEPLIPSDFMRGEFVAFMAPNIDPPDDSDDDVIEVTPELLEDWDDAVEVTPEQVNRVSSEEHDEFAPIEGSRIIQENFFMYVLPSRQFNNHFDRFFYPRDSYYFSTAGVSEFFQTYPDGMKMDITVEFKGVRYLDGQRMGLPINISLHPYGHVPVDFHTAKRAVTIDWQTPLYEFGAGILFGLFRVDNFFVCVGLAFGIFNPTLSICYYIASTTFSGLLLASIERKHRFPAVFGYALTCFAVFLFILWLSKPKKSKAGDPGVAASALLLERKTGESKFGDLAKQHMESMSDEAKEQVYDLVAANEPVIDDMLVKPIHEFDVDKYEKSMNDRAVVREKSHKLVAEIYTARTRARQAKRTLTTAGRPVASDEFNAHIATDANAMDIVNSLDNSVVLIRVKTPDGAMSSAVGLLLGGRWLMMNQHALLAIKQSGAQLDIWRPSVSFTFFAGDVDELVNSAVAIADDVVCVRHAKLPLTKNLVSLFRSEKKYPTRDTTWTSRFIMVSREMSKGALHLQTFEGARYSTNPMYELSADGTRNSICTVGYFVAAFETVPGNSGSMILELNPHEPSKLLGPLLGGTRSGESVFKPVFTEALLKLDMRDSFTAEEFRSYTGVSFQAETPFGSGLPTPTFFSLEGFSTEKNQVNEKSQIFPSPLQKTIKPTTAPAGVEAVVIDGETVIPRDFYFVDKAKYYQPRYIDRKVFTDHVEVMSHRLPKRSANIPDYLSVDQALNGVCGTMLHPIAVDTSPGFRLRKFCKKGKIPYVEVKFVDGANLILPSKKLLRDLRVREERLAIGALPILAKDAHKDERYDLLRAATKYRIVSADDCANLVLGRRLLGAFIDAARRQAPFGGSMVGLNAVGPHFDMFIKYLLEYGEDCINEDAKNYEFSFIWELVREFAEYVCNWYRLNFDDQESLNVKRYNFIISYGFHYHIINWLVYCRSAGTLSGFVLTTEMNSFGNELMDRVAFKFLTQGLKKFDDYVRGGYYGDDKLLVVRDAPEFNQITLSRFAFMFFGMTWVGADKKEITRAYTPLSEASFLGRVPMSVSGIFLGAMSVEDIQEIALWIKTDDPARQMDRFHDSCVSSVREMFPYGEERFDLWKATVNRALYLAGAPLVDVTWKEVLRQYIGAL